MPRTHNYSKPRNFNPYDIRDKYGMTVLDRERMNTMTSLEDDPVSLHYGSLDAQRAMIKDEREATCRAVQDSAAFQTLVAYCVDRPRTPLVDA